ncbi:ESCRT-I subunit protein SRN2 KNAG_0G02380 [Huiozyma naganishii CBS 8797]|uniref:VPS37 C-terminal domain-containing protein n=1 Tax=Huiozyma naganishii (strain ATCC MYA-139 / BCRC 22969 / CBS 8797 / KCTC 17520 / NBRC 10181 / NCYC 3082 / Yp74L-3) TaxID=1071383 RepID=J7S942_HUIN7|nr:hypothetical protein KNAG_0G02380 [Kazachstania naganishii CBS 8797]CCK71296.1 hypothetical protein KNAG_0G02380 [Kazachstania naganishii CBS 8797]
MTILPENIELLTTHELNDLLLNHNDELTKLCSKSQIGEVQRILQSVSSDKEALIALKDQFTTLEEKKIKLGNDVSELERVKMEYMKKWQDTDTLYKNAYSETAFKRALQDQVKACEEESNETESLLYSKTGKLTGNELDSWLSKFQEQRHQYHYLNEQLTTWEAQGMLKK